ncbi:MAG: hypothetical protein D6801_10225 [Alphaproteobacteria bacterium]|nr:MAG: hypothetical protein D6801_10225 [Alphaproteobacteria bacterium]
MTLEAQEQRLYDLIGERLGIGGRNLETRLRRGGRRLPAKVREAGALLLEARRMAASPKLAPRIDHARIAAACALAERELMAIDPKERRLTRLVNWAAGNAFNLLLVLALALGAMRWRGLF